MTEPSTPRGHLDLDALADLLAGEGTPEQVAHVSACAGCAGRLDELAAADEGVARMLHALPPPPMPTGLGDRLQAALAAEPPLEPVAPVASGGTTEGTEGRTAAATVTPFPGERRRRWIPAAAAAVLVLLAGSLGGVALLEAMNDEDTDISAASGAPEAAALDDLAVNATGTDYGTPESLAQALPELLSGEGDVAALVEEGDAQPQRESTDEAPAAVQDDAGGDVSAGAEAGLGTAAAPDPLARLREPDALASCLAALLPPDDDSVRPLALDYARYQGEPALVVVLPAQGAPEKVDVFVVGPDCALGNDSTRFFTRLDRP